MKCQALDDDANQCENDARDDTVDYYGDPEIYGEFRRLPHPNWVRVYFCDEHQEDKP